MSRTYKAIGLMSGTSLDGIDLALLETDGETTIKHIDSAFFAYDVEVQDRLRAILGKTDRDDKAVKDMEYALTDLHVLAVEHVLDEWNIPADSIDVIGFHGHTIFHDPDNDTTIQIGDGKQLAKETGINVVYDLRQADIKNGGEGAPLVPIYHWAIAQNHNFPRQCAIVNIGGVSNITYLGKTPEDLVAFDTGPGNAMVDDCVREHFDQDYDEDGEIALEGQVDQTIVTDIMSDPYFTRPAPKSLDRDHFKHYLERVSELSPVDQISTLTAVTVESLISSLDIFDNKPSGFIISGGGRHNTTMMEWLRDWSGMAVKSIDDFNINGDSVEAELCAYIAVRHLIKQPTSYPKTTGCKEPTVAGTFIEHDKVTTQ